MLWFSLIEAQRVLRLGQVWRRWVQPQLVIWDQVDSPAKKWELKVEQTPASRRQKWEIRTRTRSQWWGLICKKWGSKRQVKKDKTRQIFKVLGSVLRKKSAQVWSFGCLIRWTVKAEVEAAYVRTAWVGRGRLQSEWEVWVSSTLFALQSLRTRFLDVWILSRIPQCWKG